MTTTRHRSCAALALVVALVVSACGERRDGSAASGAAEPSSTSATPPKQPPAPPEPTPAERAAAARRAALTAAREPVARAQAAARDVATAEPPPFAPRRILLIGDSMVWFLGEALEPMMQADGHTFIHRHKASDSLRAWRYSGALRVREALLKLKPDVVMIAIGSNDYWYPRVARLKPTVRYIIDRIGDRPCYWIGPPMWRDDTGIIDLLRDHTAPCRFLDSKPIPIQRRRDGIHPDDVGAQHWARAVYHWLKRHPPAPNPTPRPNP